MDGRFFFSILPLLVDIIIAAFAIYRYYQLRLKNLLYFLTAFHLFIVSDLALLLASRFTNQISAISQLSRAVSIGTGMAGLFLIVLFIETFKQEFPFRRGIAILGFIEVILLTILALFSLKMMIIIRKYSLSINLIDNFDETLLTILPLEAFLDLVIFLVSLLLVGLFSLINTIICFRKIRKSKKSSQNPLFKKILQKLNYGITLVIVGFIVQAFGEQGDIVFLFGSLISLGGFFVIFWIYLREGIYVIQGDHLKHFLIMNTAGLPLYSMNYSQSEEIQSENKDILISGALQAISQLLSQLTGINEQLKEIHMDNTVLMLELSQDKQYITMLLVDKSTLFYQTALKQITDMIFKEITSIPADQRLHGINKSIVDKAIKMYLGVMN